MKYNSPSESVSLPIQSITGHVHVDRVVVMMVNITTLVVTMVRAQQCCDVVIVRRAA